MLDTASAVVTIHSLPAPSQGSSYLSAVSRREVNKQAVRHISVSVLRAVPTTRLKGQQPLCTAVRREVMLILILIDSERVVHFYSNKSSFIIINIVSLLLLGKNKNITKAKIEADLQESLRASDLVTLILIF